MKHEETFDTSVTMCQISVYNHFCDLLSLDVFAKLHLSAIYKQFTDKANPTPLNLQRRIMFADYCMDYKRDEPVL